MSTTLTRLLTGGVILAALLAMMVLMPGKADAQSIRVSCQVYATARIDPVAHTEHLHHLFGNTSGSNTSTGQSLYEHKETSCNAPWWTNLGWVPVEGNPTYGWEPVPNSIIYYRNPGDMNVIKLRQDMKIIARMDSTNSMPEVWYTCGSSPGNPQPAQFSPPYDCTEKFSTQMRFPRCYDGSGILTHDHFRYGENRESCPAGYQALLEIEVLVRHTNNDGVVPNPLLVSCGSGEWCDYTSMHGDYIFAAQDEFNRDIDLDGDGSIEYRDADEDGQYEPWQETGMVGDAEGALHNLCIMNAPTSLEFANARCRAGRLLPWHEQALRDYYGTTEGGTTDGGTTDGGNNTTTA